MPSTPCETCITCILTLDTTRTAHSHHPHHRSLQSFTVAQTTCFICSHLATFWTNPQPAFSSACECRGVRDAGISVYFTAPGREDVLVYLRVVEQGLAERRCGEGLLVGHTGDESVLDSARRWLEYCRAEHGECGERDRRGEYRPERLVDLCPPGLPRGFWRLVDGADVDADGDGEYVTLSHRWGSGVLEPFKLTTNTRDAMLKGLSADCLSGTYRDAMRVARRLGVRYIWIDSLCIPQDPGTLDIKVAAYKMADIYGHSSCNIATLTARQDTMFSARDPRLYSPAVTMLPASLYGLQSSYSILLAKQWEHSVLETPLSRRAWTLQEQLLPRRVLYFGDGQMMWSCSEGAFCELYPLDEITSSWMDEGMFEGDMGSLRSCLRDVDAVRHANSSSTESSTVQSLDLDWMDLLMLYCQRQLTFAEDKLLAIAGIGQLLTSPSDKSNAVIGGLMRSELPQKLLWIPDHATVRERGYEPVRLSPVRRAPSWSWAYYDGPISYYQGHHISSLNKERAIAQVVQIETDVTVVDGVEVVQGGDLRLLAAFLPLELQSSHPTKSNDALHTTWRMDFASSLPLPSPYSGTDLALKLACSPINVTGSTSFSGSDDDSWPAGFNGILLFDLPEYFYLSGPLIAAFVTTSTSSPRRNDPESKYTYRFDGLVLRRHPSYDPTNVRTRDEVYERVGMFAVAVACSGEPDVPMTRLWHFHNYEVGDGVTGPDFSEYDFEAAKGFMREFVIG